MSRKKLVRVEKRAAAEIIRHELVAPKGVSKSLAKAAQCPTYFTGQYLQPKDGRIDNPHWLTITGQHFHDWRRVYVEHLVDVRKRSDPEFATIYLAATPVSDDARTLIYQDSSRFEVDYEAVYGTELFLSIDRQFEPLEHEFGRAPGSLSSHPDFLASGQIDLLLLDNDCATIIDPKSGFSTTGVTDDEPPIYAALVMLHFPAIQEVKFKWEFVRVEAGKRASYRRSDLGWIETRIREIDATKDLQVARYNAGEPVAANPFSGLCPYCSLACPLRPRAEDGELAFAPPQTRTDAVRIAQFLKVCESGAEQARALLRGWLEQDLFGALDCGGDFVASLRVDNRKSYPLLAALHELGLDVVSLDLCGPELRETIAASRPAHSPWFDVPLANLKVSGLTGFMKTSRSRKRPGGGGVSREGMRERFDQHAIEDAATSVVIRKVTQSDEIASIEERKAG